jgi:hypothetical protein
MFLLLLWTNRPMDSFEPANRVRSFMTPLTQGELQNHSFYDLRHCVPTKFLPDYIYRGRELRGNLGKWSVEVNYDFHGFQHSSLQYDCS